MKKIDTGYLVFCKDSNCGVKIDTDSPDYPWNDIIGKSLPDPIGTNSPDNIIFRNDGDDKIVRGWNYVADDKEDCVHHIPHDIVVGRPMLFHVHWKHNCTAISGNLVIDVCSMFTRRDGQATPVVKNTLTIPITSISTHPRYSGWVAEFTLVSPTPTANQIDAALIEVDGLIESTVTVKQLPNTLVGGGIFLSTSDIHYQSTEIGTKNRAYPFYG